MAYTSNNLPSGLDAKGTPVDADVVVVGDSADSGRVKKTTWAQVKSVLKTYFDTLYSTGSELSTHIADTTTHGTTGDVVGASDTQTLTNKTLTSPVLNTGVSGTAVLDEDNMVSDSNTKVATQQSIKAYVDASGGTGTVDTSGTPVANDFARFTDADTIEGRSYAEVRTDINVEDGADVTDTANVTAAGALMDSEVDADIKTLALPASTTISAFGATVVDDADAATARTTLGAAAALGADDNYVTDAEKVVVGNTSGTNTGDEVAANLTTAGVIEIATGAETNAGTDATRAVSPDGLDDWTGSAQVTTVGTLSAGNADAAVSAASLTVAGKIEVATAAETDTGTDAGRAISPDGFQGSKRNIRWLVFNLVEAATDCATATNIAGDFVSPIAGTILQNDATPFYLYATNSTAGVTGAMVVDISIAGTSIMTTNKLDFDTAEKTTTTAATPPDLTTTALAVGDIITIDIDSIHTTAAKGLTVFIAVRES